MGQTLRPSFCRVETKFKTSQSFSNKDGWIHIYLIHIRDLCSLLCVRNVLYIHITITQFFTSIKSWRGKKDMQPDTFLKPISKVEVVSDTSEMKTLYLFVSSPMLSTLDYRVLKSFEKIHLWGCVFCQDFAFKSESIQPPLLILLRFSFTFKNYWKKKKTDRGTKYLNLF